MAEPFEIADRRWRYFLCLDSRTGASRAVGQADLYEAAMASSLNPSVPENVRREFTIAQQLCIHSWYCYEFQVVAGVQAAKCVEMALRFRLNPSGRKIRFVDLIERAVKAGLLSVADAAR